MPDILALPKLADLYGVTVDELLRGERPQGGHAAGDRAPVQDDMRRLLMRCCMQLSVTASVFFAGFVFFCVGLYKELTVSVWTGMQWWLILLYLGLAAMLVSAGVFVAFWRNAEGAFAEDSYGRLRVRRQFSVCIYLGAALSAFFGVFFAAGSPASGLRAAAALFAFALVLFLAGVIPYTHALVKTCGNAKEVMRANQKFAGKICCFALIPALLAAVLMLILPQYSYPVSAQTLVSTQDRAEFVRRMEGIVIDGKLLGNGSGLMEEVWSSTENGGTMSEETVSAGEYFLPLSELAAQAGTGSFGLGNGFFVQFSEDKQVCTVVAVLYRGEEFLRRTTFFAYLYTDETGLSFYDLRRAALMRTSPSVPLLADSAYYLGEVTKSGETFSYKVTVRASFGTLIYALGGGMLAADLAVSAAVYLGKRRRYCGEDPLCPRENAPK